MIRSFLIAALVLLAPSANAQILRVPKGATGEPVIWTSASLGLLQMQRVTDGSTQSEWSFGSALQYRGSLEYAVGRGNSVGISASYARASLVYRTSSLLAACSSQCDANADVLGVMATFHAGGGLGFHQVIEISAGSTIYRNFEVDGTGEKLPPTRDTDLGLAIGYGFGFTLNRTVQFNLVQDAVVSLHQSEGTSGSDSRVSQQYVTRLGVRLGVGNRRM